MKNRMNNLFTKANAFLARTCVSLRLRTRLAEEKLCEQNGDFVMNHAVVFVIIIVLGGAALLLLKNYMNDDLSTTLKGKINDFFN